MICCWRSFSRLGAKSPDVAEASWNSATGVLPARGPTVGEGPAGRESGVRARNKSPACFDGMPVVSRLVFSAKKTLEFLMYCFSQERLVVQ
ncbi:hypothetical protein CDAR_182921 [Caerostris darwini]|uniref:Uncharacterized protein n=1 Tax=Caerostris darwini TaxID=1538125 RepID=A0AAV4T6V9_9ARAC|nr:hypothetical protein CDAR_182921 [Caerostris darwini]